MPVLPLNSSSLNDTYTVSLFTSAYSLRQSIRYAEQDLQMWYPEVSANAVNTPIPSNSHQLFPVPLQIISNKCQSQSRPSLKTYSHSRNHFLPSQFEHDSDKLSRGETICPRRSRRIYVRVRTDPQSAQLWWLGLGVARLAGPGGTDRRTDGSRIA